MGQALIFLSAAVASHTFMGKLYWALIEADIQSLIIEELRIFIC